MIIRAMICRKVLRTRHLTEVKSATIMRKHNSIKIRKSKMNRKLRKDQSGIAVIVIIIAALVVTGGSTVAYTKVQQAQEEKRLQEEQKISDQKIAEAKARSDEKKAQAEAKQEEQSKPEEKPAVETPKPAPDTQPKPVATTPKPNITPFTSEIGCDGYTTAYASKSGGITFYVGYGAAYNNDKEGSQIIPYRTAIQVKCQDGDVVSASYNGEEGAVKVGDLSKTKP